MKMTHFGAIATIIYCCWFTSPLSSEELPASPSWGSGKQFAFGEDPIPVTALPRVVSDLTKGEINYKYEVIASGKWQVTTKHQDITSVVAIFSGPRFERTRLVDARSGENRIDLLIVHSHGYYFIVVEKLSGIWQNRLMVGIPQAEFLRGAGDSRDPTVTSAAITSNGSVEVKRVGKPDAVYSIDFLSGQISAVGQGGNDAHVIYSPSSPN